MQGAVTLRKNDNRNQPAAALLDFDQKAMPADVRQRLDDVGGFEPALCRLIPGYDTLARVVRSSTSSGLYNSETGERFPGSGGLHVYLFVRDGEDIPRFLEALQKRAWLAGLGWIMVAGRGALLTRSIVDVSVGQPERLVFEGPPLVVSPLAQDHAARQPVAREGDLLDTRAACLPLTRDEESCFDGLVAVAKQAAKPEAEAVVEKAAGELARDRGIEIEAARAVVRSSLAGDLTSRDVLVFDDPGIGSISVAEVLADAERFQGQTLADPVEGPRYGRGKAKIFRNSDGSVIVNSFAHGGCSYRLAHDAAYIQARMNEAGEGAPFVLAGLMPHTRGIDAVTRERLRNLAAKLGEVSRRSVNETIREEVGKASKAAIDAARERHRREPCRRAGRRGRRPGRQSAEADDQAAGGAENWKQRLASLIAELNARYFVAAMGGSVRIASLAHDDGLGRDGWFSLREADIRLRYSHRHYKVGETQSGLDIVKGARRGVAQ